MALSGVKTYFRSAFSGLDSEYKEWTDSFNVNNIPHTIYDKAYHLSFGTINGQELGAQTQQIEIGFVVRMFFKGYRDVSTNVDRAVDAAQSLIEAVQDPADRLAAVIKNVKFLEMQVNEGFASNDNLILVTLNFGITQFLCSGG